MNPVLPKLFDNRFDGHRAALWLLAILVALRLMMSLNSIFNTEQIAASADKFPLASYGGDGARAVLMLFALHSLAELMLALVGLIALVRYRAMVPLILLLLTAEHAGRRIIVSAYAIERSAPTTAAYVINYGMLALLVVGLLLSLIPMRKKEASE